MSERKKKSVQSPSIYLVLELKSLEPCTFICGAVTTCALPCARFRVLTCCCCVKYDTHAHCLYLSLSCFVFFIINSEEQNEETAVGHLHPIPHTDMLILLSTMKRALLHGIIFLFHLSHVYTLCVYSSDCFIKMGLS